MGNWELGIGNRKKNGYESFLSLVGASHFGRNTLFSSFLSFPSFLSFLSSLASYNLTLLATECY